MAGLASSSEPLSPLLIGVATGVSVINVSWIGFVINGDDFRNRALLFRDAGRDVLRVMSATLLAALIVALGCINPCTGEEGATTESPEFDRGIVAARMVVIDSPNSST